MAAAAAGVLPPPRAGVLAFAAVLVLSITLPQGAAPSAFKQDRCAAALEAACGADRGDTFKCAQCSGIHQKQLQAAGCDDKAIAAWCAGIAPTPPPAGSFFPGSRIVPNATWAGTLNDWMPPKAKGKRWALCFSSFTENATTPSTFHAQCDQYNTTLIMVINSLGFTFGAYAEGSWSKERCCAVQANECRSYDCYDHTASSDYLYRLSPGEPERYETIPSTWETEYQYAKPSYWPRFGGGDGDLAIGWGGPPGTYGYCNQGGTYRGHPSAACGGYDNWGHTDLEVWRPL